MLWKIGAQMNWYVKWWKVPFKMELLWQLRAGEATNESDLQSDGKYLLEIKYHGKLVLKWIDRWSDGSYL